MRTYVKFLVITVTMPGASLAAVVAAGAAVPAAAAALAPPVLDTSACGSGGCEVGPGAVTVQDSLGGSATIAITVNTKYS